MSGGWPPRHRCGRLATKAWRAGRVGHQGTKAPRLWRSRLAARRGGEHRRWAGRNRSRSKDGHVGEQRLGPSRDVRRICERDDHPDTATTVPPIKKVLGPVVPWWPNLPWTCPFLGGPSCNDVPWWPNLPWTCPFLGGPSCNDVPWWPLLPGTCLSSVARPATTCLGGRSCEDVLRGRSSRQSLGGRSCRRVEYP